MILPSTHGTDQDRIQYTLLFFLCNLLSNFRSLYPTISKSYEIPALYFIGECSSWPTEIKLWKNQLRVSKVRKDMRTYAGRLDMMEVHVNQESNARDV